VWVKDGRARLGVTALLLAVVGALACNGEARPPGAKQPSAALVQTSGLSPALRIVAVTDMNGYLEPCGCQSRPLGGVDKAATVLKQLSADRVPTVLVSAGNLFFEPAGSTHGAGSAQHDDEAKTEHLWQAEAMADVLKRFGLAAATPGAADLRYGAEQLAQLEARSAAKLLGAGRPSAQLIERGGMKIGVWGVTDAGVAGEGSDAALLESAKRDTAALRAQGAVVVLGLVNAPSRTARRIAGSVEGLDFVLVAGSEAAATPPERVGKATLLHAGKHGHGLLVVDVFRGSAASAPLDDVSAWTARERGRAAKARADELAARIAEWKKAAGTDPKLLAEQEQRLAQLRADEAAASGAKPPSEGTFAARFVELAPEVKDDPELTALLAEHDKRVNDHNKVALAHLKPPKVAAGMPEYVGSARCESCHESEFAWWRGHAHGNAYETLVKVNKQFSLKCVSCHVTGYGKAGGSTVTHVEGLIDVGCESCHGPGSLHVKDRDTDEDKNVHLEVPEPTCLQCHNEEHSDQFDYAKYKAKLIVPGHGLPLAAAPPQPAEVPK